MMCKVTNKDINPFQHSVAFHMETSHLFCSAKQMTGFYMKHNTGLKWANPFQVNIYFLYPLKISKNHWCTQGVINSGGIEIEP